MKYVIDTHLHIYPFYSLNRALTCLVDNLDSHDSDAIKVGCLTERHDCDVYNSLADNPAQELQETFDIQPSDSGNSLKITSRSTAKTVFLLPGQQIITRENLEVLSLNNPARVREGLPAMETVNEVIASGGIPVVAFGFGKWLGKRGKIVSQLIDQFGPGELALGDTTMRPYGWGTPVAFRRARKKGMRILHGSDPLPFAGEEIRPASYASVVSLQGDNPELAMKSILVCEPDPQPAGKRNTPFEVVQRMQNHRRAGKIAGH
jgi:hypothetical protein